MKISLDHQIDKYEEMITQSPEDIPSLMLYADANLKRGKKLAALSGYQKIIKIDPYNVKAQNAIVRIFIYQKMINEAYIELVKLLGDAPHNVEARFLLAQLQKKNVPPSDEIVEKLNNLPEFSPELEGVRQFSDDLLKEKYELEEQIKDYHDTLNNFPDDIFLEFDLQMCLKRKTSIEEIITFVKESELEVEEKLRQQEERRKEEEERLRKEEEERLKAEEEERLRKEEEERLKAEEEERLRKEEEEKLKAEEEERLKAEEEERLRKEEEERLKAEEEERLKAEEEERLRKEEEEKLKAEEEERLRKEEEEKLKAKEEERKKKEEIYKKLGEIFAASLQDFASNKMVSEVVIVDLTGIVVKSSSTQSGDSLGTIVAESISLLKSWKSMDYWVTEYQQGLIFIKMIARDLILVVNGATGSNLGALKIIIDKNEKELIKALRTSEFASFLDGN
ncbi:MAG: hypothetical protein ABRQ39_10225 [Candidatus Eremiobacterota bacterium]